MVGDAAQVQVRKAPGAAASDDQQVRVLVASGSQQRVRGAAVEQDGGDRNRLSGEKRGPLVELPALRVVKLDVDVGGDLGLGGDEDAGDDQLEPGAPGEVGRPSKGVVGG